MRLGAGRFVAGETLDECVVVLRRLNDQGLYANTTLLGEGVLEPTESERVVVAYEEILDRLAAEELRANVALKLTHLGLDIDEELAEANLARLLGRGQFIRIDMEQSRYVDATLRVFRRLREVGHDNVGTVLQAYLRRTPDDLEQLLPLEPNLRLVKGAYLEPVELAFAHKSEVDAAYARLAERMLVAGGHTALATHDERLIEHAIAFARRPRRAARALRAADALRRAAAAPALPGTPRPQGARRDPVRAGVVPVPDAAPRRATREPPLLPQRTPSAAKRTPSTLSGDERPEDPRLGPDDRRSRRRRADLRGRGREAVPRAVAVDGADAPLREADAVLRGAASTTA